MRQVLARKTVSWGMVIVFLLFTLASVYFGDSGAGATRGHGLVKPTVPLEEAILIVKGSLNIPAECTGFTSGYQGDPGAQSWTLQWNAPGRPGLSCNARVDAASGDILSFNMARPESQPGIRLREPAVSMEQARDIAKKLLSGVAARYLAELRPAQDDLVPLSGPVVYTFHWERVVNGVPFPANGVSVQVSGDDGRVTGYYLSWLQAAFPDAARAISPERARQVFENAGMLELQYYRPPGSRAATAGEQRPVLLVYRLVHPSGGDIDALSGTPLASAVTAKLPVGAVMNGMQLTINYDQAVSLTPEEIREVRKLSGFQSQDQALAAIRKWAPDAAKMVLESANLAADREAGVYCWNLTLKSSAPNRPDHLNARLNALTGELLELDRYPVAGSWQWGYLGRAGARKMAGEFLQAIQPRLFSEVKLEQGLSPAPAWSIKYPPAQSFNYRRMVNGIPFPANYMAVDVDTHARRVAHYALNWTDLSFPAPQDALSLQQANEAFLTAFPLNLLYVRDEQTGAIRLIYQPQARTGRDASDLLDARTGTPLGYNGKAMAVQSGMNRFTDISGVPEAGEIALLGQAGLFGEYGNAFHPDEPITAASLLRAALSARNGMGSCDQLSDQEILDQARDCGWLKEDLQPDSKVAREELARIVVRLLGLERAAAVSGIYRIPYTDAGAFSPDATGYVVLAWGLGIMKNNGSRFNPRQPVTRAEAAAVLVRALR